MKPDLSAHSSPAAPASSPLPLRRALTDVFALSAVTLGPAAFEYLGGVAMLLAPGTDRLVALSEDLTRGLTLVSVVGGGLWLVLLIRNRPYAPALRTAAVGALTVVTVWALADRDVLPGLGGDYRVAETVLCLWLVYEILQRHGISPSGARSRSGLWWRSCAIAVLTLAVLTVGEAVADTLSAHGPQQEIVQRPFGAPEAPFVPQWITRAVWAGVVEAMALTVVPVVLLRAAGAPRWQWIALPVLLRIVVSLHLGLPSLAHGLTAAAVIVLLVRYRSVLPLAASHVAAQGLPQLPTAAHPLIVIALVLAGRGSYVLLETARRDTAPAGRPVPGARPGGAEKTPAAVGGTGAPGSASR